MKIKLIILVVAIIFNTNSIASAFEPSYEILFDNGIKYYGTKQYDMAIEEFRQSYNINCNSITSYYIAFSYHALKKHNESYKYAKKSHSEKPTLPRDMANKLNDLLAQYGMRDLLDLTKAERIITRFEFSEDDLSVNKDLEKYGFISKQKMAEKKLLNLNIREQKNFLLSIGVTEKELNDAILAEMILNSK